MRVADGDRATFDQGWMEAYPGAKGGFPAAEMTFQGFHRLSDPASLYFVAAGGATLGQHPSGLPLFSLGGPAQLAAYGLNQFLASQYFYFRGGYLHRVGEMPAFLGNGLFLQVHYELAKPYGLPNAPTLPNDGVVGVVMQTIFGPVLVGGSIGNDGHPR
jgi:NTE family protein